MPGVTDTLVTVGGGTQQVVNAGTIYVKLSPIEDRNRSQEQLMADARELLADKTKFPDEMGLRTSVQIVQAFSGGGFRNANVQFMIGGPDLKKLEEYSTKLLEKMKSIPDAVDVDTTLISGKPEVRLEVDRDLAADLGVRVPQVGHLEVLRLGVERGPAVGAERQHVALIAPQARVDRGADEEVVPALCRRG